MSVHPKKRCANAQGTFQECTWFYRISLLAPTSCHFTTCQGCRRKVQWQGIVLGDLTVTIVWLLRFNVLFVPVNKHDNGKLEIQPFGLMIFLLKIAIFNIHEGILFSMTSCVMLCACYWPMFRKGTSWDSLGVDVLHALVDIVVTCCNYCWCKGDDLAVVIDSPNIQAKHPYENTIARNQKIVIQVQDQYTHEYVRPHPYPHKDDWKQSQMVYSK